jgi:hypothetical protein
MEKTQPSIWDAYREASRFFAKEGEVYETLRRLAAYLKEEGHEYAIISDMALNLHGYERMTHSIEVLLTQASLEKFIECCVGRGYVQSFSGARKSFRDTTSQVPVAVLCTGEYPGDGKPKPVSFPDPATASVEIENFRVISLEKLIELKLASGLSATYHLRDLADVQDLIIKLKLPLELQERLDASVRGEYERLWQTAQEADSE